MFASYPKHTCNWLRLLLIFRVGKQGQLGVNCVKLLPGGTLNTAWVTAAL